MAFYHLLIVIRPKQNAVVAIYGVLQLTYCVSPETDVVVAIFGVSPLSHGVSPETKRSSGHLWRFTTFS